MLPLGPTTSATLRRTVHGITSTFLAARRVPRCLSFAAPAVASRKLSPTKVPFCHTPFPLFPNDGRGGNCVPFCFFWRTPQPVHDSYALNLHFVWDVAILERDMDSADASENARFLTQNFAAEIPK